MEPGKILKSSSKEADLFFLESKGRDHECEEGISMYDAESGSDGNRTNIDKEYQDLPFSTIYYTYAGKGNKLSFLFHCHLDHFQAKKKTISVTKESRENIRKYLKRLDKASLMNVELVLLSVPDDFEHNEIFSFSGGHLKVGFEKAYDQMCLFFVLVARLPPSTHSPKIAKSSGSSPMK
ncbi:hypothetical protein OUZ56_017434 [Daphnia magna]|uniref:Uncharacterized protein n=1 Tax=Daphnia magna TaxID=35525 RepID=A0ABR0ASU4_9CRUS|nr:hypothetical protein OUZ56_017434 [Daphnia magna]